MTCTCAARAERYRPEIEGFMTGAIDGFVYPPDKGKVWVSHNPEFDTLMVEPPEGGQHAIAVRIKGARPQVHGARFVGYAIAPHGLEPFGTEH